MSFGSEMRLGLGAAEKFAVDDCVEERDSQPIDVAFMLEIDGRRG